MEILSPNVTPEQAIALLFDEPSQPQPRNALASAVWHTAISDDAASDFIERVTRTVSGGDPSKARAFAADAEAQLLRKHPEVARLQAQDRTRAVAGFLQSLSKFINDPSNPASKLFDSMSRMVGQEE